MRNLKITKQKRLLLILLKERKTEQKKMITMNDQKNSIRLNRYLALCGIGARRKVEEHILAGKVTINGEVVTEPGRQVMESDVVLFEGKEISPSSRST